MSDWQHIPDLDKPGLRQFGLLFGGIFAALFGGLFPWLADKGWVAWPWMVSGGVCLWALLLPASLKPFYRGWMRIGLLLGFVNTRIILFVVYYLVFMPMGSVMRLLGRDPLAKRFDRTRDSYRKASEATAKERMEKPY